MVDHVAHLFHDVAQRHATRPATRVRSGDSWRVQTYRELHERVRGVARALVDAGVQRGDRVAIFANNCPEWTEVDLACTTVGAVPVPIYATSTPEQIAHIVNDSGARLLFAAGESEVQRVRQATTPDLELVIGFTPVEGVTPLDDFLAATAGRRDLDDLVDERLAAASPDDLYAIIYTSGTTGDPKGVMLTHAAMCAEVHALDEFFDPSPDDHSLCFLPLSHALERGWSTYVMSHGCMNTYVPNAKQVAEMMVLARPTLMVSVPRLYETVYNTARAKASASPVKQRIFDWALSVGAACQHEYRAGRRPSAVRLAQLAVADRLVLGSIREAMGGAKTVLASGGAPLRQEIEEFFSAVGILLCQGYGLTEAAPLVSFNAPDAYRFGTAGRVMPGGRLRLGDDGEIQYSGPNVMSGYWNNPQASAEAFVEDADGTRWLRTGDVGEIDEQGYLRITDRLKDIIVTSNGKNISPQPIEGLLLSDPLFEHAVLLGDNRPCLTLLVKPSVPGLAEIADGLGLHGMQPSDLVREPRVVEAIRERVMAQTARLPHHEQIRDLRVLMEDFTMDNGLLTPTLKVKRREVEKRFQAVIDDMYTRLAEMRAARRGGDGD